MGVLVKSAAVLFGLILLFAPAFATDVHHITVTTTGGGSIQVFNLPGLQADPPAFSDSEIATTQAAGQLALWSSADITTIGIAMHSGSAKCSTAYFRANGDFAGCWGPCRDCSEIDVVGSSTGKAQISVQLP